MNLLWIYGPPASGKLTIAEEIAAKTGYKLFHNHLTQDLAREIYPEFDEQRCNLVDKLRLDVIESAAANDTNLIFTFVYSGDAGDMKFVSDVVELLNESDSHVHFVQLYAPDEILLNRVANESRQRFHKLKDPETLKASLAEYAFNSSVPFPEIYKIDTSVMTHTQAASAIIEHYSL